MNRYDFGCCVDPHCIAPASVELLSIDPSTSGPVRHVRVVCSVDPKSHRYIVPDTYIKGATHA